MIMANKLRGADLSAPGDPHIGATFNSRLGLAADCLPGGGFYLGLDGNFGSGTDLVTVLLHEIAHGLGFQTFTDEADGQYYAGVPSIWDHYLLDNRLGHEWVELTPAQRAASATSRLFLSTSTIEACTSKSRASSFCAFTRDTALAIGPASSTDTSLRVSSPWRSAKWKASARPVTMVIRNRLTESFISSACGTGPQTTVSWHMGLSSGRTASTASASPASIATSCPASAGLREPET
eukprot:gene536-615_t